MGKKRKCLKAGSRHYLEFVSARLFSRRRGVFRTVDAGVQDVGNFLGVQITEFRGFIGTLRDLREAQQGGALFA